MKNVGASAADFKPPLCWPRDARAGFGLVGAVVAGFRCRGSAS
jgi:hypothetical protein